MGYIELVKECQLTGVDLLGVDEEMLSQFGMMKVLIHQVLKQIGYLKKVALNDQSYGPNSNLKMPRSKSRDRKADPSQQNYDAKSAERMRRQQSENTGYDQYENEDAPRRARSHDHRQNRSPPRRSRDRRRDDDYR